jgi:hypothetical protein
MCAHLFAAFGMKSADEGLSARQADAVSRWRRSGAGNLAISAGTGRVVARIRGAKLCRCGGSRNNPFCDATRKEIGFRS